MNQIFYILLSTLVTTLLSASQEYPLVEPISVEHSTNTQAIVPKKIAKKESVKEVIVVKKEQEIIPLDSDMDGVADTADLCPNTSKDYSVDSEGCPDATTLNINFKYKKYNIPNSSKEQIDNFALFLKKNRHYHIIIYGYTDSIGNFKSNKKLSQNRADAVKKELVKRKISSVRITAIGKSQEDPIADNGNEEGRSQNRRIEIELLK
jgi:OOP family OmpA-OmpF porin